MTKKTKNRLLQEHQNTIYKITRRYSLIYNIPFDELISEAYHIFCKALESYNPNKGTRFNSWLFTLLNNGLNTYCKHWVSRGYCELDQWKNDLFIDPEQLISLEEEEIMSSLSDKAKELLNILQSSFDLSLPPKLLRGKLRDHLFSIGWNHREYYQTMKELESIKI